MDPEGIEPPLPKAPGYSRVNTIVHWIQVFYLSTFPSADVIIICEVNRLINDQFHIFSKLLLLCPQRDSNPYLLESRSSASAKLGYKGDTVLYVCRNCKSRHLLGSRDLFATELDVTLG